MNLNKLKKDYPLRISGMILTLNCFTINSFLSTIRNRKFMLKLLSFVFFFFEYHGFNIFLHEMESFRVSFIEVFKLKQKTFS
jgi:hypothetical protein